jgi:START domain
MKKDVMRFYSIPILLLSLTASPPLAAQKSWELKKDQEGIKVFSKPSDNSRFNELKVEMTLPAKLSSIAALVLDIDNYPNWSFNTEKSYVLKKISPSELYFYTLIHSPWPASNRDLAVHLRLTQDETSKVLSIRAECVPNYIPPKKDIIRVPLSIEQWTVTPLPGDKARIEYELKLDPGASVPPWLINLFSTKGPYETFTHLRQQIQKDQYRSAVISFIRD